MQLKCIIFNMKSKEYGLPEQDLFTLYPQPRDDLLPYAKQIVKGILDSKIYNIGLFGAYCTGKTSIIETLLNWLEKRDKEKKDEKDKVGSGKHDDVKIKRVSLAKFNNAPAYNGAEQSRDNTEESISEILQSAIVEQLVYGVSAHKLRWSRFTRLNRFALNALVLTIIAVVFTVAMWAIWKNVDAKNEILVNIFQCLSIASTLIVIILFIATVISVAPLIHRIRVKKIEGKNVSVSFDGNGVFRKYFDEILYVLSVTKYNAILFEDLDRFDQDLIYYELRRLNQEINNAQWHKKRKITFIYALKDSLIKDAGDRAKFFELPIYVTPFMSFDNAKDYIKDHLAQLGVKVDNEGLLAILAEKLYDYRQVSAFSNMAYDGVRIIKNGVLDWTQDDKILGMLLIRHCFPKEYEDMQLGRGRICDLFKDANERRNKENSDLRFMISEMSTISDDIFADKAQDVWQRIVNVAPSSYRSNVFVEYLSGIRINEQELTNKAFWQGVKRDGAIMINWPGGSKRLDIEALADWSHELSLAVQYVNINIDECKRKLNKNLNSSVWNYMIKPKDDEPVEMCLWELQAANAIDDSYKSYISPYVGDKVAARILNYVENNINGNMTRADEVFSESEWKDIIRKKSGATAFDSLGFLNYSFIDLLIDERVSSLTLLDFIAEQSGHERELLDCYVGYVQYAFERGSGEKRVIALTEALTNILPDKMMLLIDEKKMLDHIVWCDVAQSIIQQVAIGSGLDIKNDSLKQYLMLHPELIYFTQTVGYLMKNGIVVDVLDKIEDNDCRKTVIANGQFKLSDANIDYLIDAPLEKMLAEYSDLSSIRSILSSKRITKALALRIFNFYIAQEDERKFVELASDLAHIVRRMKLCISADAILRFVGHIDDGLLKGVLSHQIDGLSKEDLVEIVSRLNGEFKKIGQRNAKIKILSDDDRKIAEKLSEYGVLGVPKAHKDGKIRARVL